MKVSIYSITETKPISLPSQWEILCFPNLCWEAGSVVQDVLTTTSMFLILPHPKYLSEKREHKEYRINTDFKMSIMVVTEICCCLEWCWEIVILNIEAVFTPSLATSPAHASPVKDLWNQAITIQGGLHRNVTDCWLIEKERKAFVLSKVWRCLL